MLEAFPVASSEIVGLLDDAVALEPAPERAELIVEEARSEARSITRHARADHDRLLGEVRRMRSLLRSALALVDELDLDNYPPFHATRADLLRRLNRNNEAAAAYERAAAMAPTDAEREFLTRGGRTSR